MRLPRPRGARAWTGVVIALLAFLLWSGVATWVSRTVFSEHNPKRAAWKCEKPAGVYGTSTFDPWPPGRVCRYNDGTVSQVDSSRAVVVVVLAGTALIGIAVAVLVSVVATRSEEGESKVYAPGSSGI